MPVYDYQCHNCGKRTSRLFRTFAAVREISCPTCGKFELERRISKIAVIRGSSQSGDSDPADFLASGLDEDDPRAIARMARSMAQDMREDMPPGYDDLLGRMEAGETPDEEEFAALDDVESDGFEDSI
jgi:putative FmdB family regulatory protein